MIEGRGYYGGDMWIEAVDQHINRPTNIQISKRSNIQTSKRQNIETLNVETFAFENNFKNQISKQLVLSFFPYSKIYRGRELRHLPLRNRRSA